MKSFLKYMGVFKRQFKKYRGETIAYTVMATALYLLSIVEPYLLGSFIDMLLINKTLKIIVVYSSIYLGVKLMSCICNYCVKVIGTGTQCDISREYEAEMLEHLQFIPISYHRKNGSSQFVFKMNGDVQLLSLFIINTFITLFGTAAMLIASALYIGIKDYKFGIIVLILFPIAYFIYNMFKKRLNKVMQDAVNLHTAHFEALEDELFDIKYIKLQSAGNVLRRRFLDAAKAYRDAEIGESKILNVYEAIGKNMDLVAKIILFFYGGFKILNGDMSVGVFVIIASYLPNVMNGLVYVLNFGKDLQQCEVFYERLRELWDIEEDVNGTENFTRIDKIELKNVTFGYGNKDIIKNFSYTFKNNKIYAIEGENGAGKSTLLDLILGININEYTGEIEYNGKSIKELDMRELRRNNIGVVEQEPVLMADSIRYNIVYNSKERSEQELKQCIESVNLDDYINETDKGLETVINSESTNLSGGQKQKIALARAIYKDASLLILDEPTSALDMRTKEKLAELLKTIKEGKIIIMITHDKEFKSIADEIVHLDAIA